MIGDPDRARDHGDPARTRADWIVSDGAGQQIDPRDGALGRVRDPERIFAERDVRWQSVSGIRHRSRCRRHRSARARLHSRSSARRRTRPGVGPARPLSPPGPRLRPGDEEPPPLTQARRLQHGLRSLGKLLLLDGLERRKPAGKPSATSWKTCSGRGTSFRRLSPRSTAAPRRKIVLDHVARRVERRIWPPAPAARCERRGDRKADVAPVATAASPVCMPN